MRVPLVDLSVSTFSSLTSIFVFFQPSMRNVPNFLDDKFHKRTVRNLTAQELGVDDHDFCKVLRDDELKTELCATESKS